MAQPKAHMLGSHFHLIGARHNDIARDRNRTIPISGDGIRLNRIPLGGDTAFGEIAEHSEGEPGAGLVGNFVVQGDANGRA